MKAEKRNIVKWIILFLIIIFFVSSFVPCITFSYSYGMYYSPEEYAPHTTGYSPVISGIVSLFELLLLIFSNKTSSKILRLILNAVKVILPYPFRAWMYPLFNNLWTDSKCYYITLSKAGYIIIGIGIIISVFDIIDIFYKSGKNNNADDGR